MSSWVSNIACGNHKFCTTRSPWTDKPIRVSIGRLNAQGPSTRERKESFLICGFKRFGTLCSKMLPTLANMASGRLTIGGVREELAHWNDDRGPLVITVTMIFIGCVTIALLLGLITRKIIIKLPWLVDDYAILGALVRTYPTQTYTVLTIPKILLLGLYVETLISMSLPR